MDNITKTRNVAVLSVMVLTMERSCVHEQDTEQVEPKDAYRGGSQKKGGKIKYQRN
jgi:hypothetical protein